MLPSTSLTLTEIFDNCEAPLHSSRCNIDLRSDTVTTPSANMREAMVNAAVGDESYGEDPTVKELEWYCSQLFNKEAALFTATATMSNQIALRCLTKPGDEIVLDARHHINYYESAQTAASAGVALNTCETENGILTLEDLARSLARKARGSCYSRPALVCIENTISYYGGRVFPLETLRELYQATRHHSMNLYIDGARLLNACVVSGRSPAAYAQYADAVNICCAKGLGAPFGSVLLGTKEFIEGARKYRKWYGGGFHQVGMLAAGALYAIQENIARLAEDHQNARLLARRLDAHPALIVAPEAVETNIVLIDIHFLGLSPNEFVAMAKREGVLLLPWNETSVRAVTHLGISQHDVLQAAEIILNLCNRISLTRDEVETYA